MRTQLTAAVLLSSALIVGCSDRNTDNQQNSELNQQAAAGTGGVVSPESPVAETPPASPTVNNSAAGYDRPARSATRTVPARRSPVPPTTVEEHGEQMPNVRPSTSVPVAPRALYREVTVPAGTALALELMTPLSSETAQVETPVRARVRQAVTIDGDTAIPAGSTLVGEVAEVERAGRVQGRARLVLRFTEAEINGVTENLRTNPITFQGEATKGEDATKIGVGAGIGAAIGGLLGGGDGAAKGAAIGGAAGTGAVLATRGREVELASGADIDASLASPIDVRVPNR